MPRIPDPRFELSRITDTDWLIHDLRYRANDPRRIVACVYEYSPVEVEVVWLRDVPLAASYCSAFEALEDLTRLHSKKKAARQAAAQEPSPPALV